MSGRAVVTCSQCLKLIMVDEATCRYCGAENAKFYDGDV